MVPRQSPATLVILRLASAPDSAMTSLWVASLKLPSTFPPTVKSQSPVPDESTTRALTPTILPAITSVEPAVAEPVGVRDQEPLWVTVSGVPNCSVHPLHPVDAMVATV